MISTGLLVSEPLKLLRPYKYDAILHSLHYIMTDAGYSFAFSFALSDQYKLVYRNAELAVLSLF